MHLKFDGTSLNGNCEHILTIKSAILFVLERRCEPFPTYPRTYDMVHANGLLSSHTSKGCSMKNLLLEMDRILRPEVYFISFSLHYLLLVLGIIVFPHTIN